MVTEALCSGDKVPVMVMDTPMDVDGGLRMQEMVEPPFLTVIEVVKLVACRWS
jgi:hypothetical protein